MDCMQYANPEFFKSVIKSFNTASGMDCMQFRCFSHLVYNSCVSIPQAVWIACNMIQKTENIFRKSFNTASGMDCMQFNFNRWGEPPFVVSIPQAVWIACNGILLDYLLGVYEFQYRKRYGLHAIANAVNIVREVLVSIPQAVWIACNSILSHGDKKFESFNTASGMDCMQFPIPACLLQRGDVSIPQAVWIACNHWTCSKQ